MTVKGSERAFGVRVPFSSFLALREERLCCSGKSIGRIFLVRYHICFCWPARSCISSAGTAMGRMAITATRATRGRGRSAATRNSSLQLLPGAGIDKAGAKLCRSSTDVQHAGTHVGWLDGQGDPRAVLTTFGLSQKRYRLNQLPLSLMPSRLILGRALDRSRLRRQNGVRATPWHQGIKGELRLAKENWTCSGTF